MIPEQWQLGHLIGALAIHLLAIGLAHRHYNRRPGVPESGSRDALIDREAGVVGYPACATGDELGVRFCRSCVDELPVSMSYGGDRGSPLGRVVR